jgi:hypothetical protein
MGDIELRMLDGLGAQCNGRLMCAVRCQRTQVRSKFWGVMKANWAVWPLANLINFALIPPEQRILYVNVLAVGASESGCHCQHSMLKVAGPRVHTALSNH